MTLRLLLVLAALAVSQADQAAPPSLEARFQAAVHKETVTGDLPGAIDDYRRVAVDALATNRPLAARALLRVAACQEKTGSPLARETYMRIVREFADETPAAAAATERLRVLPRPVPLPTVRQLWSGSDVSADGRISPDGRLLSLSGDANDVVFLGVRDVSAGTTRALVRGVTRNGRVIENPEQSIFSRDGRLIAYGWRSQDGMELRTIGIDGGDPKRLLTVPAGDWLRPYDWSPDGRWIAVEITGGQSSRIALVPSNGGSLRTLLTVNWNGPAGMAFSPDGRWLAFAAAKAGGKGRGLYALTVDGAQQQTLLEPAGSAQVTGWSSHGARVLFTSDRGGSIDLMALPIRDGRVVGEPELLMPAIGTHQSLGLSSDGRYFHAVEHATFDVVVASVDVAGGRVLEAPQRVPGPFAGRRAIAKWSPSGTHLGFVPQPQRATSFFVHDVASSQSNVIPVDLNYMYSSWAWLPDGRSIAINGVNKAGRGGLFLVDLDAGKSRWLSPGLSSLSGPVISADRAGLYYVRERQLQYLDVASGNERVLRPLDAYNIALAPDGQTLAAMQSSEDGASIAINVMPIAGGESRVVLTVDTAVIRPRPLAWSADGQYVLYARKGGDLWRVRRDGGESSALPLTVANANTISVHPDGRRIAVSTGSQQRQVRVLENLKIPNGAGR